MLLNFITRSLPRVLLLIAVLLTPWVRGGVDERFQMLLFGIMFCATSLLFVGQALGPVDAVANHRRSRSRKALGPGADFPRESSANAGRQTPRRSPRHSARAVRPTKTTEPLPGPPLGSSRTTKLPWATLPIAAGLLLGLSQLMPLPRGLVQLISPPAVQLRELPTPGPPTLKPVTSETGSAAATTTAAPTASPLPPTVGWYRTSLRPTATRHDLVFLMLACAAFCLAWQLFTTRRELRLLCLLVAVNGGILALFGILQKLTWNGRFFWIGPVRQAGQPFASFVNRNNAGGYLNLCLAAGVVGLLWAINRRRQSPDGGTASRKVTRAPQFIGPPSWRERVQQSLSDCDTVTLAAMCLTICIVGGVLCSLSRGAGVGLFAATVAAFGAAVLGNKSFRSGGLGLVLAGGIGLVGWVGMYDSLLQRMETLQDTDQLASDGRLPNWLDALHGVPDYWLTGSGLGTYRDIYLLYQQRYDPGWYYYAENQYLQALVEGGLPALALLLAAIALVAWATWRLTRRASTATDYALGVGGVFALASQAFCGFADFGLYLPANMLLMAVLCGAICGRSANLPHAAHHGRSLGFDLPRVGQVALAGGLSLGIGIAGWDYWTLETTKQLMRDAGYATSPGSARAEEIRSSLASLTSRAAVSPQYEELQYGIARAYIYLYRVRTFQQLRQGADPSMSLLQLWQQASTTELHRRASQMMRDGDQRQLDALRSEALIQETLLPAMRHLQRSHACCPILPKSDLHLARICFLEANAGCDDRYLQRACRLAPSNPIVYRTAGLLDLQAGRDEQACARWRHALTLTPTELDYVLTRSVPHLNAETIVQDVLPPAPELLLNMVEDPATPDGWHELLLERSIQVTADAALPEAEKCFVRGRAYLLRGQPEAAVKEFEQATRLRPRELAWRYSYARLLFELKRFEQAEREILICARRQPENGQYRALLKELRQAEMTSKRTGRKGAARE